MKTFNIVAKIKEEYEDFDKRITLATLKHNDSLRNLKNKDTKYTFNQREMITVIDLYWNSIMEGGMKDKGGQTKLFLNVGKFRSEVAAKQIDLDVKDFRFIPDDYANTWPAFFMQKDFKEYAKENYLGELINKCVDNFPKYGSIVVKHVGNKLEFTPLQNLINSQTADSLKTSPYVIEEHDDMYGYQIADMTEWNTEGLKLDAYRKFNIKERYGYVPRGWLKEINGESATEEDWDTWVDSMVILTMDKISEKNENYHVFFADEITERPYEEAHWDKQHGRWLGVGVMEDQMPNQVAKNLVINLFRRSLHWSAKRIFKAVTTEKVAKNLLKNVEDGEVLEVGINGDVQPVDLTNKSMVEFQTFLSEWEKNSDQKAFTYDVARGETAPSGTPFRALAILNGAINQYFEKKRENLGMFFKRIVNEFLVSEFIKDMSKKDRVVSIFSDEPGFEALKDAAMKYIQSEAARASLLNGKPVDATTLTDAIGPFEAMKALFFSITKDQYKEVKAKFDLVITGEEEDVDAKIKNLLAIYQFMAAKGDPRADKVLDRIAAYGGVQMSVFGMSATNQLTNQNAQPNQTPQANSLKPGLGVTSGVPANTGNVGG